MSASKTDLSKYNNDWYQPGGSVLKKTCWYVLHAIFIHSAFPFSSFKVFLLRLFGASIGTSVTIKPNVTIKYPWHLTIGNHVWIGEQVWIDNLSRVTIKNNCCVSQGAMLLCGNHDYSKTSFDLIVKDITLEEGVWIGAKSIVCPDNFRHPDKVGQVSTSPDYANPSHRPPGPNRVARIAIPVFRYRAA